MMGKRKQVYGGPVNRAYSLNKKFFQLSRRCRGKIVDRELVHHRSFDFA